MVYLDETVKKVYSESEGWSEHTRTVTGDVGTRRSSTGEGTDWTDSQCAPRTGGAKCLRDGPRALR